MNPTARGSVEHASQISFFERWFQWGGASLSLGDGGSGGRLWQQHPQLPSGPTPPSPLAVLGTALVGSAQPPARTTASCPSCRAQLLAPTHSPGSAHRDLTFHSLLFLEGTSGGEVTRPTPRPGHQPQAPSVLILWAGQRELGRGTRTPGGSPPLQTPCPAEQSRATGGSSWPLTGLHAHTHATSDMHTHVYTSHPGTLVPTHVCTQTCTWADTDSSLHKPAALAECRLARSQLWRQGPATGRVAPSCLQGGASAQRPAGFPPAAPSRPVGDSAPRSPSCTQPHPAPARVAARVASGVAAGAILRLALGLPSP